MRFHREAARSINTVLVSPDHNPLIAVVCPVNNTGHLYLYLEQFQNTKTRGHDLKLTYRRHYDLRKYSFTVRIHMYGTVYLNRWYRLTLSIHLKIGWINLGKKIRIWCMTYKCDLTGIGNRSLSVWINTLQTVHSFRVVIWWASRSCLRPYSALLCFICPEFSHSTRTLPVVSRPARRVRTFRWRSCIRWNHWDGQMLAPASDFYRCAAGICTRSNTQDALAGQNIRRHCSTDTVYLKKKMFSKQVSPLSFTSGVGL